MGGYTVISSGAKRLLCRWTQRERTHDLLQTSSFSKGGFY